MRSRIAVLASGGGTNLQAILDYLDQLGEPRPAEVVCVASDRAGSGALVRAEGRGIPTLVLSRTSPSHPHALSEFLEIHRVDLVILAGYLWLVPASVVEAFAGRILNVHPALLPAFGGKGMYGRRVHQAVLDSGATVTGVTVHVVSDHYDQGRIVAQWPVPVFPNDDVTTLAARVLRVEHLLLPRTAAAYAEFGPGTRMTAHGASQRSTFALLDRDDAALGDELVRLFRASAPAA